MTFIAFFRFAWLNATTKFVLNYHILSLLLFFIGLFKMKTAEFIFWIKNIYLLECHHGIIVFIELSLCKVSWRILSINHLIYLLYNLYFGSRIYLLECHHGIIVFIELSLCKVSWRIVSINHLIYLLYNLYFGSRIYIC